MPRYDYKCTKCLKVDQQEHKMFDQPEHSPCCDSPVIKVYHPTPVAFKGDGWGKSQPKS